MDEIDYGELFGVDVSAQTQEAAEPATTEEQTQGGKEQEVAEPVSEDTQGQAAGEGTDQGESQTGGDGKDAGQGKEAGEGAGQDGGQAGQSPEDNARFAAARRKAEAERDSAIAKAREDAQAEAQRYVDEAFKNSGLTNPYTKQPIQSKADYEAYREKFDQERLSLILEKSGLSKEEFDKFVSNLPEVRQARAAQAEAEQASRTARAAAAQARLEEDIKAIHELDPTINEIGDLGKMESYPKFYELVQRGYTFLDAYRVANFDKLTSQTAAGARQTAITNTQSKAHMGRTVSRGSGSERVPAEVAEAYRAFNPDATDEEIRKHYNNYLQGQK